MPENGCCRGFYHFFFLFAWGNPLAAFLKVISDREVVPIKMRRRGASPSNFLNELFGEKKGWGKGTVFLFFSPTDL